MTHQPFVRLMASLVVVSAVALVPSTGFAQQAPSAPAASAAPSVTPPPAATKTESGLATQVLTPGTGTVHPTGTDLVKFVFTGYKQDGTSFKSPANYQAQVSAIAVPGLAEGIKLMVAGEKRRMWMPEKLAFAGAKGKPAGPLVFDVEMFAIIDVPTAPADVAAAPADAQKTKSGLVSKVIKPGAGSAHPAKTSTVTVHYSGWTTDGKMFDSTVLRGGPTSFPLDKVISGWTEGVQLMVTGETRRFWIPEKLAYKGEPDKPKGTLVFDVELLAIDGKQ